MDEGRAFVPQSLETGGPVAIGGVGGSGTRVIEALVSSLGYDLGSNLTPARDDLTFTVLFKRPDLYRGVKGLIPEDHPAAVRATDVFVAVRNGGRGLRSEVLPMFAASLSLPSLDDHTGLKKLVSRTHRRVRRVSRLWNVFSRSASTGSELWGWKEPNSLLFLPTLFRRIDGLRYIHVVRNGLAMATSSNDWQAVHWGFLFGIDDDGRDPNLRQLVYWARANLAAADFFEGTGRALVVSHEQAVLEPAEVAEQIACFLGSPLTDETRRVMASVRRPHDFGRTFRSGAGELGTEEAKDVRAALARFGYSETVP